MNHVEDTAEYKELEIWARTFALKQFGIAHQTLSVLRQKYPNIWNGTDEELDHESRRIAKARMSEQVNKLTNKE